MADFNRDTYQTPRPVFDAIDSRFNMVLDTAASDTNTMLPVYITEQQDALVTPWRMYAAKGCYCWNNPPYSDIAPWVHKATLEQQQGLGTVMLVFADNSVKWYTNAIQSACEVWQIVCGRISFVNPATGKKASGNDRPSLIFIWHPISTRNGGSIVTKYVTRDGLNAGKLVFIQ